MTRLHATTTLGGGGGERVNSAKKKKGMTHIGGGGGVCVATRGNPSAGAGGSTSWESCRPFQGRLPPPTARPQTEQHYIRYAVMPANGRQMAQWSFRFRRIESPVRSPLGIRLAFRFSRVATHRHWQLCRRSSSTCVKFRAKPFEIIFFVCSAKTTSTQTGNFPPSVAVAVILRTSRKR